MFPRALIPRVFSSRLFPRRYSFRGIKSSFWESRYFYTLIWNIPRFKLLEEVWTRIKIIEESKPRKYISRNFDLEVKKYYLEIIDISSVFFEVLIPRDFTPRSRVLAFSKPIPRLFISRLTSIKKMLNSIFDTQC